MTCAGWLRVFSVLSVLMTLVAPHSALARTPGPVPTPQGTLQNALQPPLSPASDGRIRILYGRQTVDMAASSSQGEAYVDLSDAGLAAFFSLHGTSIRWSDGANKTATFLSGGHYIHWSPGSPRGLVDGKEARWSVPVLVERDGSTAISLRALAQFLDFRLRPQATEGTYRFVSRIEKLELRTSGDREVSLHASGPFEDAEVSSSLQSTTVKMIHVEWAFEERSFQFGDVSVQCAGSGTQADPASMTVTVPVQWKTEHNAGLIKNQMAVRILPDFQPQAANRAENLTNLRHFKGIGEFYVMMDATGPVKHLWRYDSEHRLLTIDVPYATVGEALASQVNAEVERVEVEDMRTAAFPFARIRLHVRDGLGFEVKVEDSRVTVRLAPIALLPVSAMSGGDVASVQLGRGFIVIDPGHGGGDPGAVNRALGLREKDITLDISLRLKSTLEARGFRVAMTREDDRDVSWARSPDLVELGARVNVANSNNADLFVSIHCNSAVSAVHRGTSFHWFKPQDLPLARALEGSLANGTGFANQGLVRNRFYVLRRTTMPAVLVETAFISNPSEASRLADPAIRQKIAENIADALSAHYPAAGAARQGPVSTRRP